MPKGVAILLLPVLLLPALLSVGACGNTPPPASRTDVERGTALPPPGLGAVPASVRR